MKPTRPLLIAVFVIVSFSAGIYTVWNNRVHSQRLGNVSNLTTSLLERQGAGSAVSEGDGRVCEAALYASLEALEMHSALFQWELASLRIQVQDSATAIERVETMASRALEIAQITVENPNVPTEMSDDEAPEMSDSLDAEELHDLASARMDFIETRYANEPMDEEWAWETVTLIDESLAAKELQETSVVSADCRATMCRIEVEHGDSDSQEEFGLWFPTYVADALPRSTVHIEELENGMSKTTVYMARLGHTLPNAEPSVR